VVSRRNPAFTRTGRADFVAGSPMIRDFAAFFAERA
jgi:hypothetical protein